jgi:protein TonB
MGSQESGIDQPSPSGDEGGSHIDPYYQFLTAARPPANARSGHGGSGVTLSLVAHVIVGVFVLVVVERTPVPTPQAGPVAAIPLVWAPSPDGGGGRKPGGGGEDTTEASRPAQLVGRDALTVPVAPPVQLDAPQPAEAPDPTPRLEIPAMPVESGLREAVGAMAELRAPELPSRGPGAGPGADGGRGTGVGGGEGERIGTRNGPGGEGEGLTPGNGVSWPRLVREVKPNYTADAMRAQVEGLVELEILVLEDGSVGRVSIVRSLDARFGLDQEAINAVRRWRFDPGRRQGKAVATRVGVELSFNLR